MRLYAALLAVAVTLTLATPDAAAAGSVTLYLRGGGVPITVLSDGAPTSSSVANFDRLRNDDPGVTLKPGGSAQSGSSSKYQDFLYDPDGAHLSGGATVRVWSAVEEFDTAGTGALEAFILDCSVWATDCELVTGGSTVVEEWSSSGDWVERTISLSAADHTFADDRRLKLRIIVGNGTSGADMWIAYDSVVTPSALTLDLGEAPAPTTTTTAPTTTTTMGPTSTTPPDTTTSTGQPDDETSSTSTTTTEPGTTPTTGPTTDEEPNSTTDTTGGPPDDTTSGDTTSTTAAVGVGRPGGGPPIVDRGGLVVTNAGDVQNAGPALPVRVRIGPLRQLAVTFGTAAATIRSTFLPALALGAFGALLVITLFEQARRDWLHRAAALFDDIPQSFQRMWIALRSRRSEQG